MTLEERLFAAAERFDVVMSDRGGNPKSARLLASPGYRRRGQRVIGHATRLAKGEADSLDYGRLKSAIAELAAVRRSKMEWASAEIGQAADELIAAAKAYLDANVEERV